MKTIEETFKAEKELLEENQYLRRKYFIISYNVPILGYALDPPVYVFYHH